MVLGLEKKAIAKLQEDRRTVRKICSLDDHVLMAFAAGLTADARVLVKQARVEGQSHKLTVEYITRHVASLK